MKPQTSIDDQHIPADVLPLHPAEQALILYIRRLQFGTILRLTVQHGRPQIAEEVIRQVKFS